MSSFNTNEELDQEPCGLCGENCGQSYTCSSCGQSCDSYVVIQRGCDHTTWVCFSCESEDPKNTCERCAIDLQEDSDEEEEDEDEEKKEEENNNNNNNDSSGKPTAGPYGPTRQQEESLQQRIDALKQQQADFIRQLQQANAQSGGGGGGGDVGFDFGAAGGGGPAPKKKQPKKVSANSRRQCTLHLQRVAMAYMPEFSKLCKELDLVNKETEEAQFNIMTLDDVKARKLIKFVKRKMRAIIQKEKNQQPQCDKQG